MIPMSGTVQCSIVCLNCKKTKVWRDEAPYSANGFEPRTQSTNRTLPEGWILGPDEQFTGPLCELARGICEKCRQFDLDFKNSESPSLWHQSFNVKATDRGVFDVARPDGTRFGRISLAFRGALLNPEADAPMDVLAAVAGKIGARFEFP
jgi:hypothetical protein